MKRGALEWFVTGLGSGWLPKAPGTWGSLAAILIAWGVVKFASIWLLWPFFLVALVGGTVASSRYMAKHGKHDPKEIVIDEWAGQWLVLLAMPLLYQPLATVELLKLLAFAFIAFRFFDAVKPWPISWVDRHVKGGWGVMADDLAAAIASIVVLALYGHARQWFGL